MFPDTLTPGDIVARHWGTHNVVYYLVVNHCNKEMFKNLQRDREPPDFLLVRLNSYVNENLEPTPSVTNMVGARWHCVEGLKQHEFHYTGVNVADVLKNIGKYVEGR